MYVICFSPFVVGAFAPCRLSVIVAEDPGHRKDGQNPDDGNNGGDHNHITYKVPVALRLWGWGYTAEHGEESGNNWGFCSDVSGLPQ